VPLDEANRIIVAPWRRRGAQPSRSVPRLRSGGPADALQRQWTTPSGERLWQQGKAVRLSALGGERRDGGERADSRPAPDCGLSRASHMLHGQGASDSRHGMAEGLRCRRRHLAAGRGLRRAGIAQL